MSVFEHDYYMQDIKYVAEIDLPWEKLQDSSVVVSGSTGLLGSFLVDVLMKKNQLEHLNCKVVAIGRNTEKAKNRFEKYWNASCFLFVECDVNKGIQLDIFDKVGYVIHLASNTHPLAYSADPRGTITTNIIGTDNMLQFAVQHEAVRFVFASSCEIYGENRGDSEFFDEKYCGYIDCNTMRAGYPESKRCGEALCQAYSKQKGIEVVIPRLTRSFGPTMLRDDSKALSQFLKKGLMNEDIVLKSAGTQHYSYTYVADAVAGLLTVMLKGNSGEAYNIADQSGDIMLKDLAKIIADYAEKKVVFAIPDDAEKAGYSTATKARLDGSKLKALGWGCHYSIKEGVYRTLEIMKTQKKTERSEADEIHGNI